MYESLIIASVTKMKSGLCIGAYVLPREWSGVAGWEQISLGPVRSVRLIPAGALSHPFTNIWVPGQLIRAELSERHNRTSPHTEDVTIHVWSEWGGCVKRHPVTERCACSRPSVYPLLLREIAVRSAETGSVSKLFSGKLTRKTNGRAVLRDRSLDFSTQWWIPDLFSPDFGVLVQPIRVVPATYGHGSYLEVLEEDVSTPSSGTGQKWIFKFVGAKPVCRKKIYTYTYEDGQHVIVLRMSLARWWAAASDPEEVCYGDLSAAWAASRDGTKFVPLECDAPDESGQCACSFESAPGAYDLMWNTPRVDDLPS